MRNNKDLEIVKENNTPHTIKQSLHQIFFDQKTLQRGSLVHRIDGVNSSFNSVCDKLEATLLEIFDVIPFQESRQLGIVEYTEKSACGRRLQGRAGRLRNPIQRTLAMNDELTPAETCMGVSRSLNQCLTEEQTLMHSTKKQLFLY